MANLLARRNIYFAIWFASIALVLVTPALTGLVGLIILVLVVIATGLALTVEHGFQVWIGDRFSRLLLAAFGLITLCFLVTARSPDDLIYLANFLCILIGPPLLFLSRRQAGMHWTRLIVLMAAAGAVLTFLVGIYDVAIDGTPRAHGFFIGGPNRLGQLALLMAVICLGGLMIWRETWVRLLLIGAALLASVVVILSGSRGVAIAAVPTAVIAAWFAVSGRFHGVRLASVALLFVAGLMVIFWAAQVADFASSRIFGAAALIGDVVETGASTDSNIQIRLHLYRASVEAFVAEPLFGSGWKKSLEMAKELVSTDNTVPRIVRRRDYPHPHSDLLGFAGSMGLFGLAAFTFMVVAPWTGLRPKAGPLHRFRSYLLWTMASIFHIYALTDVSMLYDISIIAYITLGALIVGTFREPEPAAHTEA